MADSSSQEQTQIPEENLATQAAQATQQLYDKEDEEEEENNGDEIALDEEDDNNAPQATQAAVATQQIDEEEINKNAAEVAEDEEDEDPAPKDDEDEDEDFVEEDDDDSDSKKKNKAKKKAADGASGERKNKKRAKKDDGDAQNAAGDKPAKRRKKSNLDAVEASFEANDEEDATTQPKSSSSGDASSSSSRKKDLDEFEKMMQPLKSRNRRNDDDLNFDVEASNIATDLVERMRLAAQQDKDAVQQGKPATAKLALLNTVIERSSKPILQVALIEKNFLDVLAAWLEPVVKGSLPNINLRTEILKILLDLPVKGDVAKLSSKEQLDYGIDIDHLKGGIGKSVRILAAHPQETSDNAKRASAIVDKWTRLIYGRSENYKENNQQMPQESPQRKVVKKPPQPEKEDYRPPSTRARMPRVEGYDFSVRPMSKVSSGSKQKDDKGDSVQKRLSKKFLDLKKKK